VKKATLQKPGVIGAVRLQNPISSQDGSRKYPWSLARANTEEMAELGCGLMQILIKNKNPQPNEGYSGDRFGTSGECLLHCHISLLRASCRASTCSSSHGWQDRQETDIFFEVSASVQGRVGFAFAMMLSEISGTPRLSSDGFTDDWAQ
jgi:hypothetical protein